MTNSTHFIRVIWCWHLSRAEHKLRVIHINVVHTKRLTPIGVITPNQIPLTTIVAYLQKAYRSRISNHWTTIPACSVVPPIYKQSKKTYITYHFSDLQEVYSGNRQIHTKCQLQYFHPPQISTRHCVIIQQTSKAIEYIG